RPVEGWLGFALAEYWVEQARESVALFASMPDMDVPNEFVPLHMRFDMKLLSEQTKVVREAYERFNADAERSGEPVYPSAS
ncbi:hypothetical protein, partial [Archangium sp.]|uniref:hypothetical protein n=1 Tax=Archangium sp. TaxID=1872627 RepID=UPI00389A30C9